MIDEIHQIWAQELKHDDFNDTDDFFAIGGHSLIMARIQVAIQKQFGVEVPMDQLFRKSTVTEIAEYLKALVPTS